MHTPCSTSFVPCLSFHAYPSPFRLPACPPPQGFPAPSPRHTPEEAQVDFLAGLLGYKKVGWIFSQSKQERDFIMHTGELLQTAAMQDEIGESGATVMVSWEENEQGGNVHFEAFQCSEQCVK